MASARLSFPPSESAKITVHWLERSRAQRLLWLLEECEVSYDIKVYKRVDHVAPPEMREIHPLGKSPILTIEAPGTSEPLVMAESGTIFEYILDHYAPHLAPKRYDEENQGKICGETKSWLRYRYYMHYSEGSFMSLLMRLHTLHGVKDAAGGSTDSGLKRNLKIHLDFLEFQIRSAPNNGQLLCGKDLTAADIMMCFPLQVAQISMGGLAEYPGLAAYVERMCSRSAYRVSVKKAQEASGEEYALI